MGKAAAVDYFGKDCADLKSKKLFLFDMDGTIYNEESLFDGTIDLLNEIAKNHGRYLFITNNSSKSVDEYVRKVNRMGIKAGREHFFTSTHATIAYLKERYHGFKVYCQGTRSLIGELAAGRIEVTDRVCDDAQVVLIGYDTELTSEKLRNTCEMLKKDVVYLATNPDLVCPVSFGYVPDCGSICIMLKNATGKEPTYIGKPNPLMVDIVMNQLGYDKTETVIIGDRLYTDIATGVNAGITSICVLSGEATVSDVRSGTVKPTYVFQSVKEIYKCLKGN